MYVPYNLDCLPLILFDIGRTMLHTLLLMGSQSWSRCILAAGTGVQPGLAHSLGLVQLRAKSKAPRGPGDPGPRNYCPSGSLMRSSTRRLREIIDMARGKNPIRSVLGGPHRVLKGGGNVDPRSHNHSSSGYGRHVTELRRMLSRVQLRKPKNVFCYFSRPVFATG